MVSLDSLRVKQIFVIVVDFVSHMLLLFTQTFYFLRRHLHVCILSERVCVLAMITHISRSIGGTYIYYLLRYIFWILACLSMLYFVSVLFFRMIYPCYHWQSGITLAVLPLHSLLYSHRRVPSENMLCKLLFSPKYFQYNAWNVIEAAICSPKCFTVFFIPFTIPIHVVIVSFIKLNIYWLVVFCWPTK